MSFESAFRFGLRSPLPRLCSIVILIAAGRADAQLIQPLRQNRVVQIETQGTGAPDTRRAQSDDFGEFSFIGDTFIEESRAVDFNLVETIRGSALANHISSIADTRIFAAAGVMGSSEDASWATPRYDARSTFDVSFRLDSPVSFNLAAQMRSEGFESNGSYSLSGPAGDLFAGCIGLGCDPIVDTVGQAASFANGILEPGDYRLQANLGVGAQTPSESQGEFMMELRVAPLPQAFHNIASVQASTGATDLWPASNLIQGPDVGFQATAPFEKSVSGPNGNWVTDGCAFPCDYLADSAAPTLLIDLGDDTLLSEASIWGYEGSNANGASEMRLRFATSADGPSGLGSSIEYQPTFRGLTNDTNRRQPLLFDRTVTARYVEVTVTDNFFVAPGDGSQGEVPGGDRVGLGEIAFPVILAGDFNRDGVLNVRDVDLLSGQIASRSDDLAYDVDGDGDIAAADLTRWIVELRGTWVGDANLDGEFNSGDLVQVFTFGLFESGRRAFWSEGDWTGDGLFDSSDFVAAFSNGGFEQGPRASTHAVPEPAHLLPWLIASLALVVANRCRSFPKPSTTTP